MNSLGDRIELIKTLMVLINLQQQQIKNNISRNKDLRGLFRQSSSISLYVEQKQKETIKLRVAYIIRPKYLDSK